jgi:hypothetical protein
MSRIQTLRDALRDRLNSLTVMTDRSLTAVAVWVPPDLERENIASGGAVYVAPGGDPDRETNINARGNTDETFTFQIAILTPLDKLGADAACEANQILAEGILDGLTLEQVGGKTCNRSSQITTADVNQWRSNRLHVTVLQFTYR